MITLQELTDQVMLTADVIHTCHETAELTHELWGQESLGYGSLTGEPAHRFNVIEVMIRSEQELLEVMNRVKRVLGTLPRVKQDLHEELLNCASGGWQEVSPS